MRRERHKTPNVKQSREQRAALFYLSFLVSFLSILMRRCAQHSNGTQSKRPSILSCVNTCFHPQKRVNMRIHILSAPLSAIAQKCRKLNGTSDFITLGLDSWPYLTQMQAQTCPHTSRGTWGPHSKSHSTALCYFTQHSNMIIPCIMRRVSNPHRQITWLRRKEGCAHATVLYSTTSRAIASRSGHS